MKQNEKNNESTLFLRSCIEVLIMERPSKRPTLEECTTFMHLGSDIHAKIATLCDARTAASLFRVNKALRAIRHQPHIEKYTASYRNWQSIYSHYKLSDAGQDRRLSYESHGIVISVVLMGRYENTMHLMTDVPFDWIFDLQRLKLRITKTSFSLDFIERLHSYDLLDMFVARWIDFKYIPRHKQFELLCISAIRRDKTNIPFVHMDTPDIRRAILRCNPEYIGDIPTVDITIDDVIAAVHAKGCVYELVKEQMEEMSMAVVWIEPTFLTYVRDQTLPIIHRALERTVQTIPLARSMSEREMNTGGAILLYQLDRVFQCIHDKDIQDYFRIAFMDDLKNGKIIDAPLAGYLLKN